jgi:hypothetical protein
MRVRKYMYVHIININEETGFNKLSSEFCYHKHVHQIYFERNAI